MRKQIHGGDVYRNKNVIDFSSNINPLGTPESVIRSAAESLKDIACYPDVRMEKLVSALSGYENVPEEYILCGNGAAELIFMLALAVRPGKALLTAPAFAEYEQALLAADAEIDYLQLLPENGFALQQDILEKIRDDTDLVFLCNPNNPTGVCIDRDLLVRILERCRVTGTILAVDECFQDFLDPDDAFTLKPYLEEYENLFILKAFTKRYAMAGIRLGYAMTANAVLSERMLCCTQPWNVSIPAQAAGCAALAETEYVEKGRMLVQKERAFLKGELKKLGLTVFDSRANYIFFRGRPHLSEALREHGILIRDCSNYRGLSDGYYRTAVRSHEENLKLIAALTECI